MMIVDAHQDLAWNMMVFGRDYTLSADETRQREIGTRTPVRNGDTLLGWPDYQRGQVEVVFATLFASPGHRHTEAESWDTQFYTTMEEAHKLYHLQLELYLRLADQHADKFRLVMLKKDLEEILEDWKDPGKSAHPVGLVLLMEGAEGVRTPAEVESWWEWGVRIIGPAWAGTRFCGGTREPGPLTREGFQLLEQMASFGLTLDLSHMDRQAALQALDFYPAGIIASHSNALALLKGEDSNRHLKDDVIRLLIQRNGVIGIVPANPFLNPDWRAGAPRSSVTLDHVVAQIDYICQIAGNAHHVGLGTDFDGGWGLQSMPVEIDSISDLQKLGPKLVEKGYSEQDIAGILGGNWIHHLQASLPEDL